MMMKTTKIFCAALAMATLMLSCTREEEITESLAEGIEMEFTAAWAEGEASKTVVAENGTDILWSVNERINAFYGAQYAGVFTSTNTEPSAIVTFHGTLEALNEGHDPENGQQRYWAIYPYNENNTSDGESVTLPLPCNQIGFSDTFADKFFPAVACGNTMDLAFYNVCGGARFSVVTEGLQKVVFHSNDGSPITGTVQVNFGNDNKPQVLEISDAKDSVVVSAPVGGFVPGESYYAAMLPQTHKQGLTATLYTATKRAIKTINKSITVRRSTFGMLDNVDEGITEWEDYATEAEGGGTRSGMYLGIIGFNDQLYKMPIERLNAASYSRFTEFIDGLTTRKATLLYYSVGESLKALSRARYPENLFNVSLLTFTDGLDQGSSMMIEDYPGDAEYLQQLNAQIKTARIEDIPLTAYSVGLRGSDVSNVAMFRNNLQMLASPAENAFEVSDMATVNSRFQAIADQVNQTLSSYQYDLSLTIPGQANGTRMRFTLDNVSSATSSSLYIEGVFNLSSKSLTEVSCHGLTAENGETVKGEVDGVYVRFPFTGIVIGDGKSDALNKANIRHWTYVASSGSWQRNSEFDAENDASVEVTKSQKSAVVLLNLDCSTSLSSSFSTLKTHAKSFVQSLYEASIDPADVTGVTLDKASVTVYEGNSFTLLATVSPSTAVNKTVSWESSDPAVATVNADGLVTGIAAGTAVITATTVDGGFTAECTATVRAIPELTELGKTFVAVDLGLSVKWASFNLGATTVEAFGSRYAWGETSTKSKCNWSTYKWCKNGSYNQLTKYCNTSTFGYNDFTDNKTQLDPEDDAATVNLGGSWRMPTCDEFKELMTQCTWEWTTINGKNGRKITSNKSGYTDKWIFLPASGNQGDGSLFNVGSVGNYWTSSLCSNSTSHAYYVTFDSDNVNLKMFGRCLGFSVRPVTDNSSYVIGVTGVKLDMTSIKLFEGNSATLIATITPSNAPNKSVTWASSDPAIASVSATGVVNAIRMGSCTIEVTSIDGGYTASCTVIVTAPPDHEAVDLGLSVKWASCNLGATKPEEYGDYYAWGEAEIKEEYSWSTYKWCMNGNSNQLTKYCNNSNYGYNGFTDSKTVLDPEDDAATVNWGGTWHMPTYDELDELKTQCTWTWTTLNGIDGRKVTSKKSGYTDKWIFIPAAGHWNGTSLNNAGSYGNFWSSSLNTGSPDISCSVYFLSNSVGWSNYGRYYGRSVRPVCGSSVIGVGLDRTSINLVEGNSVTLIATITPSNAADTSVTWTSSDSAVATVSASGIVKAISIGACTVKVTTNDGGLTAECMVTVEKVPVPEAVDLGLSVKWASFNLGAFAPEEYGAYFAWGETEPKMDYSWSTYKWCMGSHQTMTKYCTSSSYGYNGFSDNKAMLDLEDDAAAAKLGGKWRMPTYNEFDELKNQCAWTWTTLNGIAGRKLTSKKSGYTDKWIFLPATGYWDGKRLRYEGSNGYYWSSSLCSSDPYYAYLVYYSSSHVDWRGYDRFNGFSVRPVCD